MKTSTMQKSILGQVLKNRPESSDFDNLFYQLGEPTTIQAFGRSVRACLKRGWLEQIHHDAPPQGDGAVTRELRVTPQGEQAYAQWNLSPMGENREEWKHVRGPFIGSSDVAAVFGISEWAGPWDVWDRIVLGKWDDREPGGDMRRGNKQEQNALERFEEVYGIPFEPMGMVHHPDHYELVSDVDGVIRSPVAWPDALKSNPLWEPLIAASEGGADIAFEVKCPRSALYMKARDEGMALAYTVQMQHHLAVTGFGGGIFALYDAQFDDIHVFPVMPHPKFQDQIEFLLPKWYEAYVRGHKRPDRPLPAPGTWPPRPKGEGEPISGEEANAAAELAKVRYWDMEESKSAYEEASKALLAAVADQKSPILFSDGIKVVRSSSASRRQFDRKKLVATILDAQERGDDEALRSINPDADEFFYMTEPKDKEEVKVFGRPEHE